MKLLLLLVLTLTAVFAEDDYDDNLVKAAQMVLECGQQFSLDTHTIEKILMMNFLGTQQSKCFVKCMLEKLRLINEKGEVQPGNYDESIPRRIWNIMPRCRHILVATCDDVLTLEKCNDNAVTRRMASILRK